MLCCLLRNELGDERHCSYSALDDFIFFFFRIILFIIFSNDFFVSWSVCVIDAHHALDEFNQLGAVEVVQWRVIGVLVISLECFVS
jgi:hypothetical protein